MIMPDLKRRENCLQSQIFVAGSHKSSKPVSGMHQLAGTMRSKALNNESD